MPPTKMLCSGKTAIELANLAAQPWVGAAPVRLGSPSPFPLELTELEQLTPDRRVFLDERCADGPDQLPAFMMTLPIEKREQISAFKAQLRRGLTAFGGEYGLLAAFEDDLGQIIRHGQLFSPEHGTRVRGQPSQCHQNSALLWARHANTALLATGYALSDDGLWRQHSWVVQQTAEHGPVVVETTEPRRAYFGYVMTEAETLCFVDDNCFDSWPRYPARAQPSLTLEQAAALRKEMRRASWSELRAGLQQQNDSVHNQEPAPTAQADVPAP